jgi:hypothetical protein
MSYLPWFTSKSCLDFTPSLHPLINNYKMATPFDFSSKFLSELPANTPELVASNIKTSYSH